MAPPETPGTNHRAFYKTPHLKEEKVILCILTSGEKIPRICRLSSPGLAVRAFKNWYIKHKVHSFHSKHRRFRKWRTAHLKRIRLNTARTRGGDAHACFLGDGSHRGFIPGNALHDITCPWTRELMAPSGSHQIHSGELPALSSPSSPSCPPTPTTHPQLLFFFRNFPVPTHGSNCSVQENKTKK